MSAGFSIREKVFWGSNGAVEAYFEAMAAQATTRFGSDASLTAFLQDERDSFFTGKVVFLDEWIADVTSREQLLELLDDATEQLLETGDFTDFGREWLASVITELYACIVASSLD